MLSANRESSPTFVRVLKNEGDKTLIQSTCSKCGAVFIGNVCDGLPDWERDHACPTKRSSLNATATSNPSAEQVSTRTTAPVHSTE